MITFFKNTMARMSHKRKSFLIVLTNVITVYFQNKEKFTDCRGCGEFSFAVTLSVWYSCWLYDQNTTVMELKCSRIREKAFECHRVVVKLKYCTIWTSAQVRVCTLNFIFFPGFIRLKLNLGDLSIIDKFNVLVGKTKTKTKNKNKQTNPQKNIVYLPSFGLKGTIHI